MQQPEYGSLHKVMIPENSDSPGKCDIYMTEHFRTEYTGEKPEKAMVLIQGTGAVRAGIWSRKALINESIEVGSVLPQLLECKKRGWACLVMNPNKSTDEEGKKINFSGNMAIHASFVWN